jgi:hypothetical protein
MYGIRRLLARAAALAAVAATSLVISVGTANAAVGHLYYPNPHNDSDTSVHNSGSGSTAVNVSAGRGYAEQYAKQQKPDTSTHTVYEDNKRTDSHNSENSHNASVYRDSHNSRPLDNPYTP